jgi:hypothetical protein
MKRGWLALLLVLGACSSGGSQHSAQQGQAQDLESAAIARGLMHDPADVDPTGLYGREGDRLCIVPQGSQYRVGVVVDYEDGISCSGGGTLSRSGGTLHVSLGGGGADCRFDGTFDGESIRFPGALPDGCRALCSRRASLDGLGVRRMSEGVSEASALRDTRGKLLCAS